MNALQWPLPSGGDGTAAKPYTTAGGTGGIQEAINLLPAWGGKLVIPAGYYSVTVPIDVQGKCIVIEGQGWQTAITSGFGNAQWKPANVFGSVLVAGSNDVFTFSGTQSGVFLRDLAILGPGSGASIGVNLDCTSFSYGGADNVLVANFNTGWNFSNTVSDNFGHISARGCATGFLFQNTATDQHIDRVEAQGCSTGISLVQATGLRIYNGLIQANTNGILIAPGATAVYELTFAGLWFEANTNYGIKLDSTNAAITDVCIRECKAATSGDGIVFGTLSNALARFVLASNDFRSFDVAAQAQWSQWLFQNTVFATFNAAKTIYAYNGTVLTSIA